MRPACRLISIILASSLASMQGSGEAMVWSKAIPYSP